MSQHTDLAEKPPSAFEFCKRNLDPLKGPYQLFQSTNNISELVPALAAAATPTAAPAELTWSSEGIKHTMDRNIYFDEECKIRILDSDKLQASKSLQDNSSKFISNMQQLQDSVAKYVAAIDQQVERVEVENLRAVGLRNKMAAMHEERRQKQQELQQQLKEKQQELDRLIVEEQSLIRVRAEQESLLAKLTNASSYGSS